MGWYNLEAESIDYLLRNIPPEIHARLMELCKDAATKAEHTPATLLDSIYDVQGEDRNKLFALMTADAVSHLRAKGKEHITVLDLNLIGGVKATAAALAGADKVIALTDWESNVNFAKSLADRYGVSDRIEILKSSEVVNVPGIDAVLNFYGNLTNPGTIYSQTVLPATTQSIIFAPHSLDLHIFHDLYKDFRDGVPCHLGEILLGENRESPLKYVLEGCATHAYPMQKYNLGLGMGFDLKDFRGNIVVAAGDNMAGFSTHLSVESVKVYRGNEYRLTITFGDKIVFPGAFCPYDNAKVTAKCLGEPAMSGKY